MGHGERVGRYVKLMAKEGRGDALAERLLEAADQLAGERACELYVINRSPFEPDALWVTEVWSSQAALDAALAGAREDLGPVLEVLEGRAELIEVVPVGGKGLPA
jgi:quinol monooxygenase YgiN